MELVTLLELRRQAKAQLLTYRRVKGKLAARELKGPERETAKGWICAIDAARRMLAANLPEKERAMNRLFGLDVPIPRYQPTRERVVKLAMDFCISESTLYAWREDLLSLVLMAAAELGVIAPFGLRADGASRKSGEDA